MPLYRASGSVAAYDGRWQVSVTYLSTYRTCAAFVAGRIGYGSTPTRALLCAALGGARWGVA
jgi:hypothetical protein